MRDQKDNEAWAMDHDRRRQQHVLEMIEAGLAQADREERILRLYSHYSRSGDETVLGELLQETRTMTRASVAKALKNHRFFRGEEEILDASQEVALQLMVLLREDRRKGIFRENFLNMVRAFYKNRTLDLVRVKYRAHGWVYSDGTEDTAPGWRPGDHAVKLESWEELSTDPEGKPREKIGGLDADRDEEQQLSREKQALSAALQRLYLQALLSYSREPYKPLGLCYTRVLYHVERMFDPEEIQRSGERLAARDDRKKLSDHEKMVEAFRLVQSTTTTTAPKWAMERMGKRNLAELTEDSQRSLQRHVDAGLCWSDRFREKLEEDSGIRGKKWKDIILTEEFTYKQITKLAESIHVSVFHAAQQKMLAECPDLLEEAVRLGFAFWSQGMPGRKGKTK